MFGGRFIYTFELKIWYLSNLNNPILISIKDEKNNCLMDAIIAGLPAEEIAAEAKLHL